MATKKTSERKDKDPKKLEKLREACGYDNREIVGKLLASGYGADDVRFNSMGDTLLMRSIELGRLEMVKLLVEQGGASFDAQNEDGKTALSIAEDLDDEKIIAYLASKGAPIKRLDFAALPQDEKDARLVNALDDWSNDKLPERVQKLLASGADPNSESQPLVLHKLAKLGAGNRDLWRTLLDGGADPFTVDEQERTALHVLAKRGSAVKIAQLLLEHDAMVNAQDNHGNTPLHLAAASGYHSADAFVTALLDHGADVSLTNHEDKTPVDVAVGDVRKLLLARTARPLSDDERALLVAVGAGDLPRVQELCARGVEPTVVDPSDTRYGPNDASGVAALHVAMNGRLPHEIALALLALPIDVNVRDARARTALHHVLDKNNGAPRGELVRKLLDKGADPSLVDDRGATPVFELVSFWDLTNEIELVDLLAAKGAVLGQKTKGGSTVVDKLFERTNRFSEIHDKPGFVTLFRAFLDRGVTTSDPKWMPQVEAWMASKGAKYAAGTPASNAPTTPKPRRTLDLSVCNEHRDQRLSLEVEGAREPVALFGWAELEEELENDESEHALAVREYHVDPSVEARVENGEFVPFGIVGMSGSIESYEETGTSGTLFADLTRAEGGDAPVVFVPRRGVKARLTKNDEARDLPVSFRGLLATIET